MGKQAWKLLSHLGGVLEEGMEVRHVFVVINGKRFKQWLILVVAVFFAVGIIYAEKDSISVFSQNEPAAIYSVETDQATIALTFDISWGNTKLEPILKSLQDSGVKKATFFLSSPWAKSHPDLAEKIVKAGYEIGSHGHKHANYSRLDEKEIRTQITTAHQLIAETTGVEPKLIRFPNGDINRKVLQIAQELHYTAIQWNIDSMDWKSNSKDEIVNRVVSQAKPGSIVLLHASDSAKYTDAAIPELVSQLKSKGYEFVTVSELLEQTRHNRNLVGN